MKNMIQDETVTISVYINENITNQDECSDQNCGVSQLTGWYLDIGWQLWGAGVGQSGGHRHRL